MRYSRIGLVAALGATIALGQGYSVTSTSILPDTPLGVFLQQSGIVQPSGAPVADHKILLGGIGSDIFYDVRSTPLTGPMYWMITDRGPNGLPAINGAARRTFPIPEFTPFILKVRTVDGKIEVLESIPLTGYAQFGRPISGLSNTTHDETPYGCSATDASVLTFNPHGLDTEGLVRTRQGEFWTVDEYSPSIVRISAEGQVVKRFMPVGLTPATNTSEYFSTTVLPEIYKNRRANRGFEGLTMWGERTLYAALQSPIVNPGNVSLNTRILAFDAALEVPTAEYVYRFEPGSAYPENSPGEIKISGLAMVDAKRMLVLERTDKVAKIFIAELEGATNILGTPFDVPGTSPTLEGLDAAGLTGVNVVPMKKTLLISMDSTAPNTPFPLKIEGVTVIDERTIAVANDNDFGVGDFDFTGPCTLIDTGLKSRILTIRFDQPFKQLEGGLGYIYGPQRSYTLR